MMACDISRVFRTYIRALETTGEFRPPLSTSSNKSSPISQLDKDSLLPNAFSFAHRATSLRFNLNQLSNYLSRIQHLTAASQFVNPTKRALHTQLTEQVGQMIDQCTSLLSQLRLLVLTDTNNESDGKLSQQCREHRKAVYESLTEELTRLKDLRDLETERRCHLLRLTGSLAEGVRSVNSLESNFQETKLRHRRCATGETFSASTNITQNHGGPSSETDWDLTDRELETLRTENLMMYDHLSGQSDEVHRVAQSISEISRLNQALSTHLTEQFEVTQQVGRELTGATENIQLGNELFRDALSKKASLQFWILFIVIVLTFSVNFLDWYYV